MRITDPRYMIRLRRAFMHLKKTVNWYMNHSLIIFDLDGTILDTSADLNTSLNHVLRKYGLPERSVADTKRFLGNGIRRLVELGAGASVPPETLDAMVADFKAHYQIHCLDQTRPYEGIPALIQALRDEGMKTALVSNKADFAVQELVERFFPGLFDFAVGEREGVRRKPAPDSVNEVLRALSVPRECAVYVGDSEVDVATAKNAGLPCIAVSWGFRDVPTLQNAGAERIVNDVVALQAALTT